MMDELKEERWCSFLLCLVRSWFSALQLSSDTKLRLQARRWIRELIWLAPNLASFSPQLYREMKEILKPTQMVLTSSKAPPHIHTHKKNPKEISKPWKSHDTLTCTRVGNFWFSFSNFCPYLITNDYWILRIFKREGKGLLGGGKWDYKLLYWLCLGGAC